MEAQFVEVTDKNGSSILIRLDRVISIETCGHWRIVTYEQEGKAVVVRIIGEWRLCNLQVSKNSS